MAPRVKKRYPAAEAQVIAARLVETLAPFCRRITIAGSLRRGKPSVGDIEILYVPRFEPRGQIALGGGIHGEVNVFDEQLEAMLAESQLEKRSNVRGHLVGFGVLNKFLVVPTTRIPLDLFRTTERNWGMALVVRTGPAEFNIRVMQRFRSLGMRGHAYGGVDDADGNSLECPDEETVFKLLKWAWIPPSERR